MSADPFEPGYAAARADFLQAAREAGARLASHPHPLTGREGEALAVDVAWLGPRDASRVLVSLSGTHGVEGVYGSACQRALLRGLPGPGLPADTALLAVHALNPYGYSWLRRVNEDNIDINRNWVDFTRPLPANPGYARVHALVLPESPGPQALAGVEAGLRAFMAAEGPRAAFAITGGQYTHPDGIFYGGRERCWSNRVLAAIAREWLPGARALCVLDHHTGLGPHGHTELICRHPAGSSALALARDWFGADVTSPEAGESASAVIDGNVRMAFAGLCPQAAVVAVALEVGTREPAQVLRALVADNWLHQRGDPRSAQGDAIRAQVLQAFHCDDEAWRARALGRSLELHGLALRGLQALPLAQAA